LHNGYHRSFNEDKKAAIKAIERDAKQKSAEAQAKSVREARNRADSAREAKLKEEIVGLEK
jgi:hypothetical protein